MDGDEGLLVEGGKRGFHLVLLRIFVLLLLPIFSFFFLSFLVGLLALLFGELSISAPISLLSRCRIVSSSVDLRSSKVCEIGLLNYKAKNVFSPSVRSQFRCRYDYYWASVFKVEYRDHLLGQMRLAFAEAPHEALPFNCRPNFGAAWLTKNQFKVNETYDCWYTSGVSKIRLYPDGFFSCQAKDPSITEMVKQYYFLFTKVFYSWFANTRAARYWKWEMVAGVLTGFSTSLITISIVRILQQMKSWFPRASSARILGQVIYTASFRQMEVTF
ncbi:uncharacterized protein LOC110811396 [Carica papaya]|uniref:uncharacterized protein LOC110811396 n=1 Tax=Carica papaya TaxID=3649 RepID=UPI000B8CE11D|nr:uncharacterized protein LOC110811396 [Carica papaya]